MDKTENQPTGFDLEGVYDDQVQPLMEKIIEICKQHKLPMFATFLYANDADSDDARLCTTNLMFDDRPIPEEMESLLDVVKPPRVPPLRMRVTRGDGSVEETVILG